MKDDILKMFTNSIDTKAIKKLTPEQLKKLKEIADKIK